MNYTGLVLSTSTRPISYEIKAQVFDDCCKLHFEGVTQGAVLGLVKSLFKLLLFVIHI